MFVSGMSPFSGEYFSLVTLTDHDADDDLRREHAGEPLGRQAAADARRCCSRWASSRFFGSGGFGGLFLGNATADMQLHDTYFVVGHFHLMIGGVTLLGNVRRPSTSGSRRCSAGSMNESLGKTHFWLTFVPFFIVFFMQHFLGLQGTPRRYYAFDTYEYLKETRGQNRIISIAALVLIAAQLVFLANFCWSLVKGRVAEANPWLATTLEWTVPSPPPHGNFGPALPLVHRWAYEYSVEGAAADSHAADHLGERGSGDGMTPVDSSASWAPGSADFESMQRDDLLQLGVWMFLATVVMLFAAFTSVYIVSRSAANWTPVALPRILWVNTAVLVASSVVLEKARRARLHPGRATAKWVAAGAGLGILFLAGQVGAWQVLASRGVYLPTGTYGAFVYLLTGAHGVHVIAGLVLLACTAARTWTAKADPRTLARLFEASVTFWHFLAALWLYVIALVSLG